MYIHVRSRIYLHFCPFDSHTYIEHYSAEKERKERKKKEYVRIYHSDDVTVYYAQVVYSVYPDIHTCTYMYIHVHHLVLNSNFALMQ